MSEKFAWFSYVHDITEIIYFISGIGLLLVGFWGLKQIKIAKEGIRINAQRESGLLAAKQCEVFSQNIIVRIMDLERAMDLNDVPKFKGSIKHPYKASDVLSQQATKEFFTEWFDDNAKGLVDVANGLINDLEAFSVYFTKKIADEGVAYPSIGSIFCEFVDEIGGPFIMLIRNKNNNAFSNLMELYILWKERGTAEKLENEMEALMGEYSRINPRKIKPTGTD